MDSVYENMESIYDNMGNIHKNIDSKYENMDSISIRLIFDKKILFEKIYLKKNFI